MRLTIVGMAGSFPAPDSPASCYLVEHDGHRIVLDLGNGAFGPLQGHTDIYGIDGVVLSHLHADHCIDFTSYYVARKYHPDGAKPSIPVLGPTGTGVLWMREETIEPLLLGGGMIEEVTTEGYWVTSGYPKYEAGTPNIAGAFGLRAAVKYLNRIGMDEVEAHEALLTRELITGLSEIDGARVIGPPVGENRIGVVSFTIEDLHPHDVAHLLDDQYTIIVRSGHHCCMPLMQQLGLPDGTVRASLYLYNTQEEIQTLVSGVREIIEGV